MADGYTGKNANGHVTLEVEPAEDLRQELISCGDAAVALRVGITKFALVRAAARLPILPSYARVILTRPRAT